MTEYSSDYFLGRTSSSVSDFASPTNIRPISPSDSQANQTIWAYQKLIDSIYSLEKRLDDEHEVGVQLVSSGAPLTFHLQDASHCAPNIINLSGRNTNGEELQLVQHVSQLNVLLVAMKKLGKEPVRIGFKLTQAAGND